MILCLPQAEKSTISALFYGFNCTELETTVNPSTQTPTVCQPSQDLTCSGQRNSSFSEDECLQNIAKDLTYHQSRLTAYMASLDENQNSASITELKSITNSIQTLQNCSLLLNSAHQPESWTATDPFKDRKNLCKQLKGFHVRAITITRALGYICAGEYKK
ncbi:interleukin-12 subunit alpha [Trichomycterus rosablanca]|uniref:interleukin-12 subunit alpha n=1 Tax=Trichomycterus rosablanca TaxID=2290929 RepID=UPI002F35A885